MRCRRCVYFSLVTFALAVAAAFAQEKTGGQQKASPAEQPPSALTGIDCEILLRALDTDRDGFITRQEWDRFFMNRDENKDARLSLQEMQPVEERAASRDKSESLKQRETLLARLDRDKSGTISRNEWPANNRSFRRLDANRDGVLSKEEFLSLNSRFWNELFETWDANGDGLLTRDEWLDTEESFDRLDKDRNGVIDRLEFYLR